MEKDIVPIIYAGKNIVDMYTLRIRPRELNSPNHLLAVLYACRDYIDLPNHMITCQTLWKSSQLIGEMVFWTNDAGRIDLRGVAGYLQNVLGGHLVVDIKQVNSSGSVSAVGSTRPQKSSTLPAISETGRPGAGSV